VFKDSSLLDLGGTTLEPVSASSARYMLEAVIGEGSHGVVFRARRETAGGVSSVVVKVLRPRALRDLADLAATALDKEVAALHRLAEHDLTPHVVRFFDAGMLRIADTDLELPWLAVEHVNGGVEGVTLRERVESSIRENGFAFEPERACRLVRHLCAGVSAIHSLSMLHRDIAPGNVLCSGAGDDEVFKIADFGLARVSSAETFGNVLFGTPGYCAPEQCFPGKTGAGPHSDVFAIACTVFFALTGEAYFNANSVPETLVAVYAAERRELGGVPALHHEIRAAPESCAHIDRLLALATHSDGGRRTASATAFAEALLPALSSV
jgi:eukaryotic-like serine/threonine-protein kinase